jgi:hypothetical protein
MTAEAAAEPAVIQIGAVIKAVIAANPARADAA